MHEPQPVRTRSTEKRFDLVLDIVQGEGLLGVHEEDAIINLMGSQDIDFVAIFSPIIVPIEGAAISSGTLLLCVENSNWARQTVAHCFHITVSHEVSRTARDYTGFQRACVERFVCCHGRKEAGFLRTCPVPPMESEVSTEGLRDARN